MSTASARTAALALAALFLSGCPPEEDSGSTDADGDGVSSASDCDDADPSVSPMVVEQCDGKDNDCDGSVDEGFDFDLDGYPTATDAGCAATYAELDCRDSDSSVHPGATETCNDVDDDCNLVVDDVPDADVDGYTPCEGDCDDASTSIHPDAVEVCDGRDNDCNGIVDDGFDDDDDGYSSCGSDCDDEDDDVFPGAPEECDGIDNDCDGAIDPGFDADGDGWTTCAGDCADDDPGRYPGAGEVCNEIDDDCDGESDDGFDLDSDGYLACGDPPDCDDLDPAVRPGGVEVCDGKDNDCDGTVDEGFEADGDGDGYGVCDGDCVDTDPAVNPGMPEVCNGVDDDCDHETSETLDTDGDGFDLCEGDCDGAEPAVFPGAPEVCDALDNDCDGATPDGEEDLDGDGSPPCAGDCDDDDPARFPGAEEDETNGLDDDCDGLVDEVPTASGYALASSFLLASEVGVVPFSLAGVIGTATTFPGSFPTGIEVTPHGTFLLVDEGALWEVDLDAGTAVEVAVTGTTDSLVGIARLPGGGYGACSTDRVWLLDDDFHATLLAEPAGALNLSDVESDFDGDVLVVDGLAGEVWEVDRSSGVVTLRTPSHLWSTLGAIGVEEDGDIIALGTTAALTPTLFRIEPDGLAWQVATIVDSLGASDVEVNPVSGSFVVSDTLHLSGVFPGAALLEVTPAGVVTVLASGSALGGPRALVVIP